MRTGEGRGMRCVCTRHLIEHAHPSLDAGQLHLQAEALQRRLVDRLVQDRVKDRYNGGGPAGRVLGQQHLELREISWRLDPELAT